MLDFDCFATSNSTGTTDSFMPDTAKGPTEVYSSDTSTTQFNIDIAMGYWQAPTSRDMGQL